MEGVYPMDGSDCSLFAGPAERAEVAKDRESLEGMPGGGNRVAALPCIGNPRALA